MTYKEFKDIIEIDGKYKCHIFRNNKIHITNISNDIIYLIEIKNSYHTVFAKKKGVGEVFYDEYSNVIDDFIQTSYEEKEI